MVGIDDGSAKLQDVDFTLCEFCEFYHFIKSSAPVFLISAQGNLDREVFPQAFFMPSQIERRTLERFAIQPPVFVCTFISEGGKKRAGVNIWYAQCRKTYPLRSFSKLCLILRTD
jgi:hypothetical protein